VQFAALIAPYDSRQEEHSPQMTRMAAEKADQEKHAFIRVFLRDLRNAVALAV
jgi:hypothetical protein